MTHNRRSNFYGVNTRTQAVYTKFIKVVLTDYSAFGSSSKMIYNKAAAAVSQGKRKKRRAYVKP